MISVTLLAIVLEDVFSESIEGDATKEASRDDSIGVDVVARQMKRTSVDLGDLHVFHEVLFLNVKG